MKETDLLNEVKEILPLTIWDDLASSDILIEYLRKFTNSNINTNPDLRMNLLGSLYAYSTEIMPEVEEYYGEKYINVLTNFNQKVSKWQNQKQ
ncbi:MAG: hypothetical protein LBO69_04500 [Ignavibacteria bacterium]|jgi:hypothetical protein|nr:hypothetical protein [Ignavibacteria bacterium]